MIFDQIASMMEEQMKKDSAANIARKLNRERKMVYNLSYGCGFRCDLDFVLGLHKLGYDLKLVRRPA